MNEEAISQMYLKDTSFQDLMQRRIFNILLIASPYDAFLMEEDGRVEEQLYFEYMSLNLSSAPRFTLVANAYEAFEALRTKSYDLVITMPGGDIHQTFVDCETVKRHWPDMPIVVLTPFSKEVSRRLAEENLDKVDYVFSWLGNVDLLLAIIKLLEDKMNADNDILNVGVQTILLVEDSVRFYSSVLPHLYKFMLTQSREFSTEALNEHEQMLRMRGRPKVLLARDYEEAVEMYKKYGRRMLGVITDVSFHRQGVKDRQAGLKLSQWLREQDPYLPIIVESSEIENADRVEPFGGIFIDKNSKKLSVDLGEAIMEHFGFGDFVIRSPRDGHEIMRIRNLKDLQRNIFDIPDESLYMHASHNDISRWLYSRALFAIADPMKLHRFNSLAEAPAVKQLVFDLIVKYRKMKNRGVVAVFRKDRFDHYSNFARIGQGSMGGKGRGLAFIDSIIKKNPICDNFNGVTIQIPRTVVICTDVFDKFMSQNRLYPLALSDAPDSEILDAFLNANLPASLREDFDALFDVIDRPLAVRSSSLLEDSQYQPFAGIYSTYMIPHLNDRSQMMKMLTSAVKAVYASVFYAESKAYMTATSNVIDQEKMAVILQEVVGEDYNGFYMPSFAGVGRSLNYYPIGDERAQYGVAQVAIGLGKYIVDGCRALRFSPGRPGNVVQTSTLENALRETQTKVMGLDLKSYGKQFQVNDSFNILEKNVQDFAGTGALKWMVSTYDATDQVLRDGDNGRGRRVVTFANMLRDKVFPLAQAIDFMLKTGSNAMRRHVEIEFAGIVNKKTSADGIKGRIYWLQIRPIVDRKSSADPAILNLPDDQMILKSYTALGHGNMENIDTIIYVRPENFDSAETPQIAKEIEELNRGYIERGEHYVLCGPGRWGTSDSALGIPVKWASISAARVIVEAAMDNYRIEPSQGTHFFQNLTSFGVGYFTVNPTLEGGGIYNVGYLDSLPAVYESRHVRVVRFASPLRVAINGAKGLGVVAKPS